MENHDKLQDTELFRENLKEKILAHLYTRSIKEVGMIPGFKWDDKAKQWGIDESIMQRVINEMIDEGDVETRAFYTIQLTKQGRIKAKERKLDQKYSEERYKNSD